MENRRLRLAIPNGNLQQATVDLFQRAGYKISISSRSYFPGCDDPEIECLLVRPQEQPRYVHDGIIDVGFTGVDLIEEAGVDVVQVLDLAPSKLAGFFTRWVLIVPNESPIREPKDLEGKRIATELVNVTKKYLEAKGINALVEYSYGATEVKAGLLADAIMDVTVTGNSIRANNLRIIDTVMTSTPRIIASKQALADEWKRQKIDDILLMLQGAMAAEGKVWLSMNVPVASLEAVLAILPALDKPTVAPLSDAAWCDVTTIVDEAVVRLIVPRLKRAGARGIVEYPLSKIIE